MKQPSSIIAHFLIEDQAVFTRPTDESTWPLYERHLPDEVDDAAVIFDTAGILDGRLMIGTTVQHYGFQIMIRSKSSPDGWNLLNTAGDLFDLVHMTSVVLADGTFTIQAITRTTPLIPMGLEEGTTKRRYVHIGNFIATIVQDS